MNVVLIMTDTQNKTMVSPYGGQASWTPSLSELAKSGITFENCYTSSPVCTPARGAIFSGLNPQVNGAICNNLSPGANVPLMGDVFRKLGFRSAYTGKWHLDGAGYFGDGMPDGGFEGKWWYDGKRYVDDIGDEMFRAYRSCRTASELQKCGFTRDTIWGHRVADRAIDFLQSVSDPFLLVCSFDEPHEPSVAPPEYWQNIGSDQIPRPDNFNASVRDKPLLAQLQRKENGEVSWEEYSNSPEIVNWYACNSYIDSEIGRVVSSVLKTHGEDTMIIYTADHGDQHRAHGLLSKGAMMYEESTNVPFIVRMPESYDGPRGVKSWSTVSHLDILPTVLDYCSLEVPEVLHGTSLRPVLEDPNTSIHDAVMINFHRFAINHDSFGAYYPIRCATDGRYKLVINLHDHDEFYDLVNDPIETHNRIDSSATAEERDRLHDWLLSEMDRIRDPLRTWQWANRPWRTAREPFYRGGANRAKPAGFSFEASGIEA